MHSARIAMGFVGFGLLTASLMRARRQPQPVAVAAASMPTPSQDATPAHGHLLPMAMVQNIPELEKRVLLFLLRLFREHQLPIRNVLVNGGYVRDLLLGQVPDDLDVSLCLCECAPEVSVESILDLLDDFAKAHPELGVATVKTTTIVSDESKNKQIDTAKATVCMHDGTTVELDLMPTIGKETYDDLHNRIPTRDHRGTPEDDALRRDLTIGALFLAVSEPSQEQLHNEDAISKLEWRLLDYYGGVDDVLLVKQLRAPFPSDEPIAALIDEVLDSQVDVQMWNEGAMPVYLNDRCGGFKVDVKWISDKQCVDARVTSASTSDVATGHGGGALDVRQPVWWVKVLKDDPLRIVRTLRFAAKLDFGIHDSFWVALPFALPSLKSKVAGSRKVDELVKLAKMGKRKLQTLFMLSLARTFAVHDDNICNGGDGGLKQDRLAVYLFGGNDGAGVAHYMRPVLCFDQVRFTTLMSHVPNDSTDLLTSLAGTAVSAHESLLGIMLAIALDCATFGDRREASDAADQSAAVRDETLPGLELHQFDLACNGLCTSNHTRAAGMSYLRALEGLGVGDGSPKSNGSSNSVVPVGVCELFERRMPNQLPSFELLCRVWVALCMAKSPNHYIHQVVVAALAYDMECGGAGSESCVGVTAAEVDRCIEILRRPGPSVRGDCFKSLSKTQMPVHMRAGTIVWLNVFGRCERFEGDIHTTEQLQEFLAGQTRGSDAVAVESRASLFDEVVGEWTDASTGMMKGCYEQPKVRRQTSKLGKR